VKVIFAMTNLKNSGGTRVIIELAHRLQLLGHDVALLVPRNAAHGSFPLSAQIYRRGLILRDIPYLDLLSYLATTFPSVPNADAVIATYFYTAWPVALRAGSRAFYYVQHYESLFCQDPHSKIRHLALQPYRGVCESTYRLPFHFLANSHWVARVLKERFDAVARVVHPGVDTSTFCPRPTPAVGTARPKVLAVGRRAPWKGFCDLDRALQILWNQRLEFELMIASQEEIPISGEYPVKWTRPRTDEELVDLYHSADLVVHPAWYEGFGLPVLEAMACGTPVVVTRCGGVEDFAVHQMNCWMVEPQDPPGLAEGIRRVLSDSSMRSRFAQEGPVTARAFAWDKSAQQLESALFEALNSGGFLHSRESE
jgi:glycosyltransferase involved in cell wall biosynthesis